MAIKCSFPLCKAEKLGAFSLWRERSCARVAQFGHHVASRIKGVL